MAMMGDDGDCDDDANGYEDGDGGDDDGGDGDGGGDADGHATTMRLVACMRATCNVCMFNVRDACSAADSSDRR